MWILRRASFALTLFAIAGLLSWEARAASPRKRPNPATSGSIAGRVISGGSAIPEATVHVWRDGKQAATLQVDQKGEFHYPTPEGTYEVQASAPHFQPAIPVRITVVVHAQHETWVNLELRPGS
jgi:hypothetical protein